ncbi:MAG: sugar ABC transporter ATP-binding protein [bacterium]
MDGTTQYALEMRQIAKRFGGTLAVDDVNLRVAAGSVHALLGANGAGKSTLMKILDGVYPANSFSGEIRLRDRPVRFRSPHDAREQGIGYVPQEIEVIEDMTVAENIYVGRWNDGRRSPFVNLRRICARAGCLLETNGIPLDPRRMVVSLSASERQMVMIARALVIQPSILILDESTAALTLPETRNVFAVVRLLSDRGVATLFISHRLEEIFELADRATVLRDGRVAAEFERAEFDRDRMVAAMTGRRVASAQGTRTETPRAGEALRVENLTVPHPRIANRFVVRDVSFAVRPGEILGLGGLVGSGRSSIVNALYGRVAHRGRVWVAGREVGLRNPREARRHGIGLVPEERRREGLLWGFPIRENIALHCLSRMARGGVLQQRREDELAGQWRERLRIRCRSVSEPVSNLSGGNQQKVVLAKVLADEPRVLLLDEPTKGVDIGAKSEIHQLILSLAAAGVGIVVISSELPELFSLCDRVLVLDRGRIADEFSQSDANEHRFMLAATGAGAKESKP